ncbi:MULTISPECIES: hypothetical protein [Cyanophyceae]|uniref:hypothetical protein n=1 Tax=Cyanophyceae TaxID=3028117 RepID=UPI001F3D9E81|nr:MULTISPECIES: hypothetical protein [Cyanophyceae]MDB9321582.1 hypothetical protein [Nodularia spumigena CS-591/07A]MDB9329122.1 hypothetical protein [Nodularia spumigena CS-591/04]MDB9349914.1 hypothetical protein [Nodularia spumigena CS-588/01]MDB9532066.1 hypothetical protein [Nodularia spumigena CS-1038]MDB9337611.1 hypothetical protein [Nodularia spumigena CS-590/01]
MTTVRIAVARLEFTFSTPILANMVVKAAKPAQSNAYIHHIFVSFSILLAL